jgi:hypothetical protein
VKAVEAAAQYIRAHHADLDISAEWRENFDVAVPRHVHGNAHETASAGLLPGRANRLASVA